MPAAEPDLPFAVALRRAREDARVSQADMARALGMCQSTLSRMECWADGVRETTVRRYAAVLGCRVELRLVPIEDEEAKGDGGGKRERRKVAPRRGRW